MPQTLRELKIAKGAEASRFHMFGVYFGLISMFCWVTSQTFRFIWTIDYINQYYVMIYAAIVAALIGDICAIIELKKSRSRSDTGIAIVGLILSAIALVLALWRYFYPNFIFYL